MLKNKKVVKIFVISIVAIFLIWLSLLVTDSIRTIFWNEKPIFAIPIVDTIQKDGGSGTYKGIGYSIEIKANLSTTSQKHFNIYYTEIKILNFTIYRK